MATAGSKKDKPCCCGQAPVELRKAADSVSAGASAKELARASDQPLATWAVGSWMVPGGEVPRVATTLGVADRLGGWRARWGIGRMRYIITPGLYAVGSPMPHSPVLVTANFKMSFDRLRAELGGRDAWILVLETQGINVWCAAGKGTFGTEELIRRIRAFRLSEIVSHQELVVPQLGAPGVCGHEVKKRTGFKVVFGPVRATDLPAFLDGGQKATPDMRRVRFGWKDRVVLIPVELVASLKVGLLVAALLFFASGFGEGNYSLGRAVANGWISLAIFSGALLAGVSLVPALLPWLPGRPFAVKGAMVGLLYLILIGAIATLRPGLFGNWAAAAAWLFLVPAVTSYLGLNFTGASTFTSLSGVLKEMRAAVPFQVAFAVVGLGLWVAGLFI